MHIHAAPLAAPLNLPFTAAAVVAANAATLAQQPTAPSRAQGVPPVIGLQAAAQSSAALARFCRSANDPVRDASRHHEARMAESDAQYAAEDAAHRDTLALARGGDYARLLAAMDYRDNDTRAMHALVTCAQQGHALARDAIEMLARTWAETHTEAL